MDYITSYAIYTNGHIEEDGTEVFPELVKEMRHRQPLLDWAKIKKLNPHDHHICALGYELIDGLKVPDTGEPEFLNQLI